MRHSPIDRDRVVIHPGPDDPTEDGSLLVGVCVAILIELGVALVVLLLFWLF